MDVGKLCQFLQFSCLKEITPSIIQYYFNPTTFPWDLCFNYSHYHLLSFHFHWNQEVIWYLTIFRHDSIYVPTMTVVNPTGTITSYRLVSPDDCLICPFVWCGWESPDALRLTSRTCSTFAILHVYWLKCFHSGTAVNAPMTTAASSMREPWCVSIINNNTNNTTLSFCSIEVLPL